MTWMRSLTLLVFESIFLLGLGQSPEQYLGVRNREGKSINDAIVTINGKKAIPKQLGMTVLYRCPDVKPPYDVEIRHKDYHTLHYEGLPNLEIGTYLLRDGEDSVYMENGWRPCLPTPGQILVVGKESDSLGNGLDRQVVRESMHRMIASHGYEIIREQKHYNLDCPGPSKENCYLVKPAADTLSKIVATEIERFAMEPIVSFAGPVILFQENGDALSLRPWLEVYVAGRIGGWIISFQQVESAMAGLGFAFRYRTNSHVDIDHFEVQIHSGSLDDYNQQIRSLLHIRGVYKIHLWDYRFTY